MWTISYQYRSITFSLRDRDPEPGSRTFDFDQIDQAWKCLMEGNDNVWVWTDSMMAAARFVMERHQYVKAAGGVVANDRNQDLLIFRNGHWDLPKGMIEPGESPVEGTIREVEEETGVTNLEVEHLLLTSYHIYDLYGGWHIKKTYWYRMRLSGHQELTPQTEEGIERCEWCDAESRDRNLNNSYSMMKMINNLLK